MRNLDELNINEGGRPVRRPRPTRDQLSMVERFVGAKLPAAYIALLLYSNGGHPEIDTFIVGNNEHATWDVCRFFHLAPEESLPEATTNLLWQYRHRWKNAPQKILPIACDGGGNLICLDLTDTGAGRVVLWVHDEPNIPLLHVADSFDQFIDGLTTNPDYT